MQNKSSKCSIHNHAKSLLLFPLHQFRFCNDLNLIQSSKQSGFYLLVVLFVLALKVARSTVTIFSTPRESRLYDQYRRVSVQLVLSSPNQCVQISQCSSSSQELCCHLHELLLALLPCIEPRQHSGVKYLEPSLTPVPGSHIMSWPTILPCVTMNALNRKHELYKLRLSDPRTDFIMCTLDLVLLLGPDL